MRPHDALAPAPRRCRPFSPSAARAERDDGLRRARPFARPSGLNWLQVALRMGDGDRVDGGLDALGPFDLPSRSRR